MIWHRACTDSFACSVVLSFCVVNRKVIALLDKSDSELTQTVACSDLGEFARFHPDGKRIITQFGGKNKLMALMAQKSGSGKVTSAALLAVQKLMVNNWEHLAPGAKNKKTDE